MTEAYLKGPKGRHDQVCVSLTTFPLEDPSQHPEVPFTIAYLDLNDRRELIGWKPTSERSVIAAALFTMAMGSSKPPLLLTTEGDHKKNGWVDVYTCNLPPSCRDCYRIEEVEKRMVNHIYEKTLVHVRLKEAKAKAKNMGGVKPGVEWYRFCRTPTLKDELEPIFRSGDFSRARAIQALAARASTPAMVASPSSPEHIDSAENTGDDVNHEGT